MITIPARRLRPGDVTEIFYGETVTVARVDRVRPGFVRVTCCLGPATDTPEVVVTLPDEASALVTRGPAASYIDYLGKRLADHPAAVDAACELARVYAHADRIGAQ